MIMFVLTTWTMAGVTCYFAFTEKAYNEGYEAGKNHVPESMKMVDSCLAKYDSAYTVKSDSIEILIQNVPAGMLGRAFKVYGTIREVE